MSKKSRQVTRSQKMLRNALMELLKEKPLHKIGISEITDRADLARSTFYTHFETKEDLLHCCIDETIASFFEELMQKEGFGENEEVDIQSLTNYFRLWSENTQLVELFSVVDLDKVIVDRLRVHHFDLYENKISLDFPDSNPVLAEYYRESIIYTNFGLLKFWVNSGMRHSPEVMGKLLYELTGPAVTMRVNEKLKDKFK